MNKLKNKKKEIIFIICSLLIMGVLCLILYQPLMKLFENPQQLRIQLQAYGILGQLILALIMSTQIILAFLPGEIIEIMAGYIYGPINGLIICLIGSAIGSFLIYIFIKTWGIRFINRFIDIKQIEQLQFLQNKENLNIILFIIFFIPGTPKDVLTYFIPLTNIKFSHYLFITTLARIPSIITSTIGGHALGVEDYLFSIIVFVITGIISLIGLIFYKKITQKQHIHCNL